MSRQFDAARWVVASHNQGKITEIADLFCPLGISVVGAAGFGLVAPDETGTTFAANAQIKSMSVATSINEPALADDSGLVVEALDGEPGIYSARWAGPQGDFFGAMHRVQRELLSRNAIVPERRRAHFVSALALGWPDGYCEVFEGMVGGHIVWPPRGDEGFGYDSIFQPTGYSLTFGEMKPSSKKKISHRTIAFFKLLDACFSAHA